MTDELKKNNVTSEVTDHGNMKDPYKDVVIDLDGVSYMMSDFDGHQQRVVSHISDLNERIFKLEFDIEQAQFSRNAFIAELKKSIKVREALKDE